jgi:Protein of unknown function (DUF2490)
MLLQRFINYKTLSLFAIVVSVSSVWGQTAAPHSADQAWIEQQIAFPLNNRVDFVLLGYFHFGQKAERPVAEHVGTGVGASVSLGKHVTLFPFYTHFENQTATPVRSKEERFTLETTFKLPFGRFTASYRDRFEYHWRQPRLNFIHSRHRFQIEHPLVWHNLNWFIGDEFFYDTHFSAWIRNRAYAGVAKKFNRHLTLEFYYLRQNDGHSHPGDLNVFGNTLKFRL